MSGYLPRGGAGSRTFLLDVKPGRQLPPRPRPAKARWRSITFAADHGRHGFIERGSASSACARLCDRHRQRRAQRAPIYARAAQTMGSKRLHTWIMVKLPASLPFVVSGMKQGWAFAWRSLMAAEVYVTILTGFGLGHLLHYGRELQAMDQVIAIMLVIILIGLLADKIVFSPWERFLHHRWGTTK